MTTALTPKFVEFIPEVLEDDTIYISRTYATAVHKCCCGCGQKVVTPLSSTGWRITVDGDAVTLYPSIGNWSFPCRSHYWIRRNAVHWSYQMSQSEIDAGRRYDAKRKERHFAGDRASVEPTQEPMKTQQPLGQISLWQKLKKWLFG